MKYRVVGWTEYDNPNVPMESCSPAAMQAILRDIRENGYLFTGWYTDPKAADNECVAERE